jgi:hypothetical protein
MHSRKQWLAVVAIATAALGSAASDGGDPGEFGSWELSQSVGGPAVQLGGSQTHGFTAEINAEATSEGDELGYTTLEVQAYACVTSTSSTGVRVRGTLLPESGSGPVAERDVPACPATQLVSLLAANAYSCTSGGACGAHWSVRFDRIGAAGTDLQIAWDVVSVASFYGDDDVPPTGAALSIEVDP